jgi:type VI secretion system protein ImpM
MSTPAGFFGKLRSHGDFVMRRLPPEFIEPWDACLQRGMLHAREALAEHWLEAWLSAPVWMFALGAGVCGDTAWAGVQMPGVDRVGRYFPLTVAARVIESAGLHAAQRWYDNAAALALSTLAAHCSIDEFDAALAALPFAPDNLVYRVQFSDGGAFGDWLASVARDGASAWWTQGAAHRPACAFETAGLPAATRFAQMLDGGATSGTDLLLPLVVRDVGDCAG